MTLARLLAAAAALALAAAPAGARPVPDASTKTKPSATATSSKKQKKKEAPPTPAPAGTHEEKVDLPGFGEVQVYRPEPISKARGVVLFVSGDGGWNLGVVDMARRISDRTIVAGLSMPAWQKRAEKSPDRCWYPAGELEVAAQALEKILKLPHYVAPILVGYSSGATVVYGALAQAPPTTFTGAVSLGFCPDIEVGRPMCGKGEWKPTYDPKKHKGMLPEKPDLAPGERGAPKWVALQGDIDQVCDPKGTLAFVQAIPAAKIVYLEKVGHGFSVPRRWGPSFDDSVISMLEPQGLFEKQAVATLHVPGSEPPAAVRDRLEGLGLPLVVSWPEGAREAVIFVSGDGGWAELDQSVAKALAERGVAVVGWNTLRYFWSEKSPERFREDLAKVVDALPRDVRIYAGGYSFGAEVIPVTVAPARASEPMSRIAGLVLLGPGPYATFEVSALDWIRTSASPTDHPVPAAITAATGLPVLCVDTADNDRSGCHGARNPKLEQLEVPGGHHFGGDYDALAGRILTFLREDPSRGGLRRAAAPSVVAAEPAPHRPPKH